MIPERTVDASTKVFDDVRANKMNFNEFQLWMEEQTSHSYEDGWQDGYTYANSTDHLDFTEGLTDG